jgi:HEAT repeats
MQHRSSSASESHGIWRRRLFCVAVGLVLATVVIVTDAESTSTEAQSQTEFGSGSVQFADGRLSVNVDNVSLETLLREIAARASLTLKLSGRFDERISTTFNALPLDKALQRLLRRHNFALEYAHDEKAGKPASARLSTLWIYSQTAKDARPVASYTAGPSEFLQPSAAAVIAEDPDPSDRGAAVETLADKRDAASIPALRLALRDRDQQVREAAIAALVEIGGDQAANALADVLNDNEPWLREVAVTALGEIGGNNAIRLLQRALSDSDESVKDLAATMLEQLKQ